MNKFIQNQLSEKENIIITSKPSRLGYLSHYFIAILMVITALSIPFALSIIIFLIIIGIVEIKVRFVSYVFTNNRVIVYKNFLSRNFIDTNYSNIKNTYIKQGIIDLIIGIGNVSISTAGTGGIEQHIKNVKDYENIQKHLAENTK